MLLGVLLIAPDALLIRLLEEAGSPRWPILVWKSLFGCATVTVHIVAHAGGPRAFLRGLPTQPRRVIALGTLLQMGFSMSITLALCTTTAERALLLFSLSPLWSALLGWCVLGERIPCRTWGTMCVAAAALGLIFIPPIFGLHHDVSYHAHPAEVGHASLVGDLFGVASGMCLAGFITLCCYAGKHEQGCNMSLYSMMGMALGALVALLAADGKVLPSVIGFSGEPWHFFGAAGADGVGAGLYYVCISSASSLIPGFVVAVIALLEIVLGPLCVILVFGNIPPITTLLSGILLLLTLALHEATDSDSISNKNSSSISSSSISSRNSSSSDSQ